MHPRAPFSKLSADLPRKSPPSSFKFARFYRIRFARRVFGNDAITDYSTEVPGLDKILLRKITLKPGASWSLAVPDQSVCQGVKGVPEVVNKTTGKISIFNADDRRSTVSGHEVTLNNNGTVDYGPLFYTLIMKK